jgi:phage gp36-like protein
MSSYCSQSDLLAEIKQSDLIALTDDAQPPTGVVDQTILNQVIQNASGEIDSYLANIYQTPFSPPYPYSIVSMAVIITCYRLFRRRLTPDETNLFYEDYKRVVEFLKAANNGLMHIDQLPPRTYPQGAASTRFTIYGGNVFGGAGLVNSM